MAGTVARRIRPALVLFVLLVLGPAAMSQDLAGFEKRLTKFTLDNGLAFLVLERHEAPVVSFHTYADVGAVDEVTGFTGLAHLFEHMAFKGTQTVGTNDYQAAAAALAKMDDLFVALRKEKQKGDQADPAILKKLQEQFDQADAEAQKYIVHDEYEESLTQQGADGFNAYTSEDATQYIVSLPSNKLELWMMLEAERFAHPVLREFYKEKDVVMEERRMMENSPTGRLYEEFEGIAFIAHPYRDGVIGHMSDLQALSRPEAEGFFKAHYGPSNLTIAIVGDVDPVNVKRLAAKYFASVPSGPKPEPVRTVEPPQRGERRVTVEDAAQPVVLIGYHQPNVNHADNAPLEVVSQIVGVGRTSRLYKDLVKDKKIAVSANAGPNPSKYPSLFLFYVVPAKGHTTQECEQAVYAQIEKLKTEPVSPEELKKAKTRSRASVIRELDSNSGLAAELTFCEVVMGDWRNFFKELDKIEQVTAADVQRVAQTYFTKKNRTVGVIETASVASR
ncbi:MAG: pitrilysin family protein [Phycisphaerae bacterium]|nr:pitrilysin family protein [Phycisphaerae bacterium]